MESINLAINKKLISVYPEIWIEPDDIRDGFKRPSFFVDFSYHKTMKVSDEFYKKDLSVTIYYFPSNRNKYSMENLEVGETLEDLFLGKLVIENEVDEKVVPINSVDLDTVDGVLQTSFDLEVFISKLEADENELMGDLEVSMKEEE